MVRERKEAYAPSHSKWMIIGIMMCILAAIPMFVFGITEYKNMDDSLVAIGVGVMLAVIAVAVKMIVHTSIIWGGMEKLLEEGDYTRLEKRAGRYDGIYWAVATAIYLGWSFMTNAWDTTWIVWPIAGVLFGGVAIVLKTVGAPKK